MGLGVSHARVDDFPRAQAKCMNCGKQIEGGIERYSRRFCSDDCRAEYVGQEKK